MEIRTPASRNRGEHSTKLSYALNHRQRWKFRTRPPGEIGRTFFPDGRYFTERTAGLWPRVLSADVRVGGFEPCRPSPSRGDALPSCATPCIPRPGADEKTRTSTGLRPRRPERRASTNSATSACFSAAAAAKLVESDGIRTREAALTSAVSVHPQRPHSRFDASRFYPSRFSVSRCPCRIPGGRPQFRGAAGWDSNPQAPVPVTGASTDSATAAAHLEQHYKCLI